MTVSVTVRLVRSIGLAALFVAAALFGIASGVIFAFAGDLPEIKALDDYAPSTITRVLGRDGSVVGEFATERREIIHYQDIPADLRNAILSAEDANFFKHGGLSLPRMFLALGRNLVTRGHSPGGSTLTQQLARNLFPVSVGFERTGLAGWERKTKEALVAVQIEKRYTKQEIFTMYCNQIYFGHGAYGVQAAARMFFGKPVQALTLAEAATIAGIIQGNVSQSPFLHPDAALRRRNYALRRMAEEGYITAAQAETARALPMVTHGAPTLASTAPYFLESIRQHLEEHYGAKAVYESGLTVKTGLDPALQVAANRALDAGVRRIDQLHGYRKPAHNILAEGRTLETYRNAAWTTDPSAGRVIPAVVTSVEAGQIRLKIGRWSGVIDRKGYDWTHKSADLVATRGDLIDAAITRIDAKAATFAAELSQPPLVEGAVLAIDNRTGQVLAMVGGTDFDKTQFNRATQALRQVGSAFKPFVYTAAIDRGYTVRSIVSDEPVSFNVGPNQPLYQPQNYEHDYEHDITLRQALARSRNIPAVKLMNELGIDQIIQFARRFGLTAPLPPVLSLAVGSGDLSLLEMTSAYTAFPNQGVRMAPLQVLQVVDRDGNVLEETRADPHEAIRADTAYVMTTMLEGVIDDEHGTGHAAKALGWPLGGKTGTTDEFTDAWFIGFDPDITIGVWVGYDKKKSLGAGMAGAQAALPIWMDIMQSWVDRRRAQVAEPPQFERPSNIVLVQTGTGIEAFIAGTEPAVR